MTSPAATTLNRLLTERTALEAKRDGFLKTLDERAAATEGPKDLTPEELTEYRSTLADMTALDERIPEVRAQIQADEAAAAARRALGITGTARIISEPTTYRQHGEHSWFRDLARATEPGTRDEKSAERLVRHRAEMDVLYREAKLAPETRANMSTTDGQGGEFVPPLWLLNQYIPLARAGRVTADLCRKLPLPAGTDTISMPSVATGATVAGQTQNAAGSNTDMTTSSTSATVRTAMGQQRIAMQLLDQSPIAFDEVIFSDLLMAYAAYIDGKVINGAGAPDVTGLLGTASINAVTYTDASPTVGELYPKMADALQKVHTNRFLPPQAWVMHPVRWAWFTAALDSNGRPLVVPTAQGAQNAFAGFGDVRSEGSVGSILGLPVYVDANVPTTLGGGTEDAIMLVRFDDVFLYEGALRTRVLFETDADTLQVRFQLWAYYTLLATRYPKSIAKITGTGLAAPTF